jgi:carboxypeptidase Q
MVSKHSWLMLILFFLPIPFLSSFAAGGESDHEIAARLIAEALKPSPLETNLRRLTDEIGGRIPGTPAFQRAVDWGEAAFKDAGADSVHTEEFSIQNSWAEGATSVTASLHSGTSFPVHAVSVAWRHH